MNKKKKFLVSLAGLLFLTVLWLMPGTKLSAEAATDEILNYDITVSINEDATANLDYKISWKVLDDSIGALDWVQIGIPNNQAKSIIALTDNIANASLTNSSGSYAKIEFTNSYYEGDIVDFEFIVVQDAIYTIDSAGEYVEYTFTPGWFDEIAVDNLTLRWNSDKVSSWEPACLQSDGYCTWTTSLSEGETYTVSVKYPIDAYEFNTSVSDYDDDSDGYDVYEGDTSFLDIIADIIIGIIILGVMFSPVIIFGLLSYALYKRTAQFGTERVKEITRTKVTYYPVCQGCGAVRPDGADKCEYCGRSFIQSEETITEKQVAEEDKDALKYNTNGCYHYGSDANTYMRVNVITHTVPRHHYSGSHASHSSSCAHSSCAHSSCACACAGGGRAGCTTKDFYSTKLKLKYLKRA